MRRIATASVSPYTTPRVISSFPFISAVQKNIHDFSYKTSCLVARLIIIIIYASVNIADLIFHVV